MCCRYTFSNIGDIGHRDVFFDANILIYLFGPTGKAQRTLENNYSTIYSEILKRGLGAFVNFVVISEVVNRTLRINWFEYLDRQSLTKEDFSFKAYRNSEEGQEAQEDIATMIKEVIFSNFEVIEDSF